MKEGILLSRYLSQLKSFKTTFNACSKKAGTKNIHRLRVTIKKIRALNQVLLSFDKKFSKINGFKMFDRLFKKAGELREAQVNRKLIENHSQKYLSGYKRHLNSLLKDAEKGVRKEIKCFDFNRLKQFEKEITAALKHVPVERQSALIITYLQTSVMRIKDLAVGVRNNHTLHSIRKHLRIMVVILSLFDGKSTDSRFLKLKTDLMEMLNQIGSWHDQLVLLTSMRQFSSDSGKIKISKHFDNLISKNSDQCRNSRNDFIDIINQSLPLLIRDIKELDQSSISTRPESK